MRVIDVILFIGRIVLVVLLYIFLFAVMKTGVGLSLIHISEPTRQAEISYAVFCLKKKKKKNRITPVLH